VWSLYYLEPEGVDGRDRRPWTQHKGVRLSITCERKLTKLTHPHVTAKFLHSRDSPRFRLVEILLAEVKLLVFHWLALIETTPCPESSQSSLP
jgi:hypothetical protein